MSIQGFVIEDFDESLAVPQTAKFLFQYGNKYYKVPLSTLGGDVEDMLTVTGGDFNDGGDTAGVNRSLGNNDAYALSFETGGTTRIFLGSTGNVGIGTSVPSAGLHINKSTTFFQTTSTTSGVTLADVIMFDYGGAGGTNIGLYTANDGYMTFLHRKPENNYGATIYLGNDTSGTNEDGISFKTGTTTSSSSTFRLHIEDDGNVTIVNGLKAEFSATASDFAKLNIKSAGNTSATMAFHIRNSEASSMFKVWDNGRIGINKSATPSAVFDLFNSATGSTAMQLITSGSGEIYSQYANGNIIIGSGISAGVKVAIKGSSTAYAFTSTTIPAALHVVGTLRFDEQSATTAGAFATKYLKVNIDGTAYKIQLYANA